MPARCHRRDAFNAMVNAVFTSARGSSMGMWSFSQHPRAAVKTRAVLTLDCPKRLKLEARRRVFQRPASPASPTDVKMGFAGDQGGQAIKIRGTTFRRAIAVIPDENPDIAGKPPGHRRFRLALPAAATDDSFRAIAQPR